MRDARPRMRRDPIPPRPGLLSPALAVQDPRPTPARYVNDALEVALKRDVAEREALRRDKGERDPEQR